ncbi:hypothetical protein CRV24_001572 [Beauveria bassiana]|nr:hypothetical protein CRV24_001572 [Beauveria bassiana]
MYEEEDQGVPESWGLPPHRTVRRAMSQTDAYIAALIARKSGMGNFLQTNNGFFSTRFSNYMNDGGNTSRSQSNYTPLAVDDYRRQPVPDAKAEVSFNTLDYSPLSERRHTLYSPAELESSVDCSSLASPTFPAASSQTQAPSPTSSSSDMLTYDSNHAIDFNSESGKQSLGMLSLNLEEFLVDMESDSSLNLTQDGMLVRYS